MGIDDPVLVKTFQYSLQLNAIIGGVYPNQCINVASKSTDEVNAIVKVLMVNMELFLMR